MTEAPKILTVIQARMSSSRLPGKVLLSVCSKPLLLQLIERVSFAQLKGEVVVATSLLEEDNVIEELCVKHNINVFRGHPDDLLDRHYRAALKYNAEAVVKIPSDCPLIDPVIIDKIIKYYIDHKGRLDYVSNLHPASYPDGNDIEIISFKSLETAWKEAVKNYEREHTTPFIWENPGRFRIGNVRWELDLDYSSTHRWTIDYEEDYVFVRTVYEELYMKKNNFGLYDIISLLVNKPYISQINKKYAGRYWYENYLDDLTNIKEFKENYKKVING